jgi:hypothetical protein
MDPSAADLARYEFNATLTKQLEDKELGIRLETAQTALGAEGARRFLGQFLSLDAQMQPRSSDQEGGRLVRTFPTREKVRDNSGAGPAAPAIYVEAPVLLQQLWARMSSLAAVFLSTPALQTREDRHLAFLALGQSGITALLKYPLIGQSWSSPLGLGISSSIALGTGCVQQQQGSQLSSGRESREEAALLTASRCVAAGREISFALTLPRAPLLAGLSRPQKQNLKTMLHCGASDIICNFPRVSVVSVDSDSGAPYHLESA